MALYQVDFGKRVPFPDNPSGWYYWSSVYYIDTADLATPVLMANYTQQREELLTTEDVLFATTNVKSTPGRGNIIYTRTYSFGQNGLIPAESGYSLINIARWRLRSSTGRSTWRLNRMPLRPSDQDGERLSVSGLLLQEQCLAAFLSPGRCRNSHGELLTDGEVVRPLVKWQLRHGTRRRARNPQV